MRALEEGKVKLESKLLIYEWLHQISFEMGEGDEAKAKELYDEYIQMLKTLGPEKAMQQILEGYFAKQIAGVQTLIGASQQDIEALKTKVKAIQQMIELLKNLGQSVKNPYGFTEENLRTRKITLRI